MCRTVSFGLLVTIFCCGAAQAEGISEAIVGPSAKAKNAWCYELKGAYDDVHLRDINNNSTIVGYKPHGSFVSVMLQNGTFTEIGRMGALSYRDYDQPNGINNDDVVVGYGNSASGSSVTGYVWDNGQSFLAPGGKGGTNYVDINDQGVIIGVSQAGGHAREGNLIKVTRSANNVFRTEDLTSRLSLPVLAVEPYKINNNNVVIGRFVYRDTQGAIRGRSGYVDLDDANLTVQFINNFSPRAINDMNEMADVTARGFVVWYSGQVHELGFLPGGSAGGNPDINNHGDVVGGSLHANSVDQYDFHGVLFRSGQAYDLNDLMCEPLPSDQWIFYAFKISDKREILAYLKMSSGESKSAYLKPRTLQKR